MFEAETIDQVMRHNSTLSLVICCSANSACFFPSGPDPIRRRSRLFKAAGMPLINSLHSLRVILLHSSPLTTRTWRTYWRRRSWCVAGRGRSLRMEVWRSLWRPHWAGPHQRTTPFSGLVIPTLNNRDHLRERALFGGGADLNQQLSAAAKSRFYFCLRSYPRCWAVLGLPRAPWQWEGGSWAPPRPGPAAGGGWWSSTLPGCWGSGSGCWLESGSPMTELMGTKTNKHIKTFFYIIWGDFRLNFYCFSSVRVPKTIPIYYNDISIHSIND